MVSLEQSAWVDASTGNIHDGASDGIEDMPITQQRIRDLRIAAFLLDKPLGPQADGKGFRTPDLLSQELAKASLSQRDENLILTTVSAKNIVGQGVLLVQLAAKQEGKELSHNEIAASAALFNTIGIYFNEMREGLRVGSFPDATLVAREAGLGRENLLETDILPLASEQLGQIADTFERHLPAHISQNVAPSVERTAA
jgi:hypothetical protein